MSAYTVTAKCINGSELPTLEIANLLGDRWIGICTLVDAPDNKSCHYLQSCPESVAAAIHANQWKVEEKDTDRVLTITLDHIKRDIALTMHAVPENALSQQERSLVGRITAVENAIKDMKCDTIRTPIWKTRHEFIYRARYDCVVTFAFEKHADYIAYSKIYAANVRENSIYKNYIEDDDRAFELMMHYYAQVDHMCIARVSVDNNLKITHVLLCHNLSEYTVAVRALPYSGEYSEILQTHFVDPSVEILRRAVIGMVGNGPQVDPKPQWYKDLLEHQDRDWALFKVRR